ncbi:ABC transporter family substrate-binding protein [Nocardiopsis ganjiahuensis]|uniref:ABC transporter family substrate-binding protein n=1 Tax=Nocardiopsis ganjiahuensis TaxID=239984 RepID=UPI000349BD7C|nr:ABC transporter family substrate-binding protein [Nocardiopsis ganjiahuensis]
MFKRRKTLALAAAAASAVLVASGCSGDGGGGGEGGPKEVTWVINSLPGAWQATSLAGGSVYVVQMLSGVLPYTGQWQPDATYEYDMDVLAEEPTLVNDDPDEGPFEWSITLADDAVWSDGEPMTGEDLRVSWMLGTSPEEGYCADCDPRASTSFDKVDNVQVDGKTATFQLKEGLADPEWMGLFDAHSQAGGFLPAHLAEENGWDVDDPDELGEYYAWLHAERPDWSGGPFIITEGDLENEVVKEPNPNYFGEAPALDKVTMLFNTDEGTFVNAFVNGEIDGANPADYSEDVITQVQDLPNAELTIAEGATWEHVDLNLKNEQLQDVELRRAIFTAIDRDDIANRNFGGGYPDYELKNNHVFAADSPYYVDHFEGESQGTGDLDEARSILEEAGYEGFESGETLSLDGDEIGPFRLRSTDSTVRNTSVQLIQAQLAEIGITANIEMTDDLGGMLAASEYDIVQYGWSGSPYFTGNADQFWHSESGSNYGGYSNEEVDDLAQQSVNAPDLDTAADLSNQAMEILVPDAYVLPIMAEPNYFFANTDRLVNVQDNLQSSYRATYNIGEWDVAS